MAPVSAAYAIRGTSVPAIVASVEEGIRDGALRAGDPLPSVRRLAADLGVSPTTVAAAYRLLRERGATRAVARSRTVVTARSASPARGLDGPVADGLVDLATGGPDPALLPDLRGVVHAEGASRGYAEAPVLPALVEAAAERCGAAGVDAGALTLANGAMDGVERVLVASVRPGDAIAVEDPGYPAVHDLARVLRLRTLPVAVDDEGLDPDGLAGALRAGARAVVLSPRGQNPLGASVTAARAAALRAVLAQAPDVLVCEDDHLGAVGDGAYRTLTGGRARWAWVHSVAKALGPDLRLAVVAGDPGTVGRVEARMALGPGWVSGIVQEAVVRLWADPALPAALARARDAYAARRTALRDALASRRVPSAGVSGFNVWVPVAAEAPVVAALATRGWGVRAGQDYRIAAGPGIRICAAVLDPASAEAVADAVAAAVRPQRRTRGA